MTIGRWALAAYGLFLPAYGAYLYFNAAPPSFSADYARSVAMLTALTGLAPFFLSFGALKASGARGAAGAGFGLAIGLVIGVLGYGLYWWFVLAPLGGAPAIYDVAPRGIGWGLLQGGLASLAANH